MLRNLRHIVWCSDSDIVIHDKVVKYLTTPVSKVLFYEILLIGFLFYYWF